MPIDYGKYPANWQSEIVPRILARAMHCCEFCGLPNGQTVWSASTRIRQPATDKYMIKRIWIENRGDWIRLQSLAPFYEVKLVTVVLTVAHLDHDEDNHEVSDDRLAALCQHCHLNYDALEKWNRVCSREEG